MLSKTFCVLPWYSEEINGTNKTPCCLLEKNYDIAQIKKDLLSDIRNKACQKCWDIELSGQDSRRVQENRFLDWKLDRDIEKIQHDCINGHAQISMYQVYLSNLCNQACVTCNSGYSTKWVEIEKKMAIVPSLIYDADLFDYEIDFRTVQRINLLGGEPMFDPRSFELLKMLLDHGNDQCFISFVTNGSVRLTKFQKNILEKFKNLNICFSIDGIESRFEYMRWPGRWNKLLENINQYKTITDNFSVSYTISAVNAIYYDETVAWFEQNLLRYNHNIVHHPGWASLDTAPLSVKRHIENHRFLKDFARVTGSELSNCDFKKILIRQDVAKKIDFKNYLPELSNLLNT
jgi:MoaA/NifB/PqqE/SkfB family radical SAM enzyme